MRRSGFGVVLMDPQHEVIAALGEPAGALSPLAAELAALMATVKTAVARGARYLRVHTDCRALGLIPNPERFDRDKPAAALAQ